MAAGPTISANTSNTPTILRASRGGKSDKPEKDQALAAQIYPFCLRKFRTDAGEEERPGDDGEAAETQNGKHQKLINCPDADAEGHRRIVVPWPALRRR